MAITGWPLTLEQFLALPEAEPALEYGPDGEVTQKTSPTIEHGALQLDLGGRINEYARARGLGRAYSEHRLNLGGRSPVPDVTFYRASRRPTVRYPTTPPDLVIEIASPGQSRDELAEKCRWYVEQGSILALLVDPEERSIGAFAAGQAQTLQRGQELPLDEVLPGLQLSVDEVFAALT
jgi:Uma2 family endonuclease